MKPLHAFALLFALSTATLAGDWRVFRGNPSQDGVSADQLPDKLEELWQFKTGNNQDSIDGAPVVAGGVVYLSSLDKHLYAINLADGKQKWRFATPDSIKASPAVSADGRRVYVGDQAGNFFCVEAATGKEAWKVQAASEVTSGPSFAGDKILFGTNDESLYCLDDKGTKLWEFRVPGGPVMATAAVDKDLTFLGGCDSKLHIIDINTGKEKAAAIELNGQMGATASLKGGMLYVGTMSAEVVAIDVAGNKIAWTFESGRSQPFFATTAVTDKYVIAGSRDKRIYCIDRATGKKVWDFVTEGRVEGSPAICGDRVYAGSLDGNLYVIDLAKGTQLLSIKLDSGVSGSIAIADGKLLVGTQNGTLYCFGKK